MKRVALISGSAKRIGKALAQHLASKGWSLALHYHTSEEEAKNLQIALQHDYPDQNFTVFRADLKDIPAVHQLMDRVVSTFGQVDLLLNNASAFQASSIRETTVRLLDEMMLLNFKVPFLLMSDFANRSAGGVIINLADTRITTNQFDYAAYTLSKKALWELTKMGALEFAPHIRVNAIAPGMTLPPAGRDEAYLEDLAGKTPMKRPGGLEPILKSLDYILDNDYLTGQLVFCDGGENLCSR